MPVVKISARIISWPDCCACCLGRAEVRVPTSVSRVEGVEVIRTTTSSWRVPYCMDCRDHQDARRSAQRRAGQVQTLETGYAFVLVLTVLSFLLLLLSPALAVLLIHLDFFPSLNLAYYLIVASLMAGGSSYGTWKMRQLIPRRKLQAGRAWQAVKDLCCPACACLEPAVDYLDWYSSVHRFRFANPDYADLFEDANRKKIVG